jgi:hypothetical protein
MSNIGEGRNVGFLPCSATDSRGRIRTSRIIAGIALLFMATSLLPCFADVYTKTIPSQADIKTVAIISAIGETFMFERISASPLQWLGPPDASFLQIADWGMDARVTRQAAQALSKTFVVKPARFEEADFDTWTWPTLLNHIEELPMHDIDAYVVILRDWCDDGIGGSVHQIAGLGLYRLDGNRPHTGIFACYRIAVIGAHDDKVLASRAVVTISGKLPWLPVTPALWPKTQNDLSAEQTALLEKDSRALMDETLTPALDEIFSLR